MDRKILLIGLLAVVGLGLGADTAYRTYVETPFKEQEKKRTSLLKQQKELRRKMVAAKTLVRDMEPLQKQSLPADPDAARQQYLAWWWQTVKNHQWQNPSVDLGQPAPVILDRKQKDAPPVHQISGTIRGIASLQQATDLMDQFYSTPLLHQIDSLQMTPVAGGQALNVKLTISALSLENAIQTNRLPDDAANLILAQQNTQPGSVADLLNRSPALPATEESPETNADEAPQTESSPNQVADANATVDKSDPTVPDVTESSESVANENSNAAEPSPVRVTADPQPWQSLVKRNVFQPGGGLQIASQVTLSAITRDAEGNRQAWFRIASPRRTEIINQGETLRIGVLSAVLVDTELDHAIMRIEGMKVSVPMGQPLSSGVVLE